MLYDPMTLSGIVSQSQNPTSALFVPVKAAMTPPAEQNKPLPGEGVDAAKVASFQTTAVNPSSKEAKGTESDKQYCTLKGDGIFWFEDNLTDSFLHHSPKKKRTKYRKYLPKKLISP